MSVARLLVFSLPCIFQSVLFVPVMAVFPTLYEKYYGANFAALGVAMALSRSLDSVVDPVIAYLSDRTRSPWGARKPWLVGGGVLGVVAAYQMFLPSGKPDALYFLIWSSLVYLAWSIMQVPHDAWATEISGEYEERTRIFTYKGTAGQIGGFLFLLAPIVLQKFFGFTSTEMTPGVMHVVGAVCVVLLPVSLAAAVLLVPKARVTSFREINFKSTLQALAANRPYRLFLLIFALQGTALGIYAAMILPFMTGYLRIPEQFAYAMTVATFFALLSTPPWMWVANRFGKHQAWAIGSLLTNIVLVGWLFTPPGPSAVIPTIVISGLYGAFSSCAVVCYPSLVGDINDYGLLRCGASRPGTYFAGVSLLVKLTSAIGGGLALALIGFFGFTTHSNAVMSTFTKWGVLFTFIGLHTLLQLAAVYFIIRFPLNRRNHAIIRRRLEQRLHRSKAGAAVSDAH
jgi:glycoside/pentoside/hexuronide:cation symporter, GPH family